LTPHSHRSTGHCSDWCIATDPNLLTVEHYKAFLTERRQLIAERLNAFLA